MKTEELKPCPFCGGEAKVDVRPVYRYTEPYDPETANKKYWVQCIACHTQCGCLEYDTPQEAIAAWNRRTEPEARELTLDELADAWHEGTPVYAMRPDKSPIWMRKGGMWCVLDGREVAGVGFQLMAVFGYNLTLAQSDYGKTWTAYAQRPEEAAS